MSRSTPWVDGCCGPMLMIMVSSSETSMSTSSGSTATPSGRRRKPSSRASSRGSRTSRSPCSSWSSSEVSSTIWSCSSCVIVGSSPGSGRFLELHRHPPHGVVLAQRMTLPVLRHEDAGQVWVGLEDDPEHVVDLALHGVRAGPEVEQRRHAGIAVRYLGAEPQPPAADHVDQRDDDLEALAAYAIRHRPPRMSQVVDRGHVGAQLEAVLPGLAEHLRVAVAG